MISEGGGSFVRGNDVRAALERRAHMSDGRFAPDDVERRGLHDDEPALPRGARALSGRVTDEFGARGRLRFLALCPGGRIDSPRSTRRASATASSPSAENI